MPSPIIVTAPYEYFANPNVGRPIADGYIYVGLPDLDPTIPVNQTSLIAIQEDGTEVPLLQPVRTNAGGLPTYNGSVVQLSVEIEEYSISVYDRNNVLIYYQAADHGRIGMDPTLYRVFDSVDTAKSTDLTGLDEIQTISFYPGWEGTAEGPKGRASYYRDGTMGSASTIYPDNTGFFDPNGDGFSQSPFVPVVDSLSLGAVANQSTWDTTAINNAMDFTDEQVTPISVQRNSKHDSDIWLARVLSDSKELNGKGTRYSWASLPRFFQALTGYNEATSTGIKVMGMGSSVGNGATLPDPSTQAPVAKFTEFLNDKFNKLGIINFTFVNESVDGSTINDGDLNVDTYLAANNPDIVVLAYGMNDGGVSIYNAGQQYPACWITLKRIILKCQQAGADVVVMTTPHPLTSNTSYGQFQIAPSIGMGYPIASFSSFQVHTFTAATSRITAAVAGTFTDPSFGFGMAVGKVINVAGTANNNGDFTVASIDGSGDFITVVEAIVDEAGVTSTVKRIEIDNELELIPPESASVVELDGLGYGPGHEIEVSYRHYRVNQAMRRAAIEMGVPVIDVEQYWFEALYRNGGDSDLFNVNEYAHPNLTGHRQSYWYGMYQFVEAMAECYAHGNQQNALLPYINVNDADGEAAAAIRELLNNTNILDIQKLNGDSMMNVDSAAGIVFGPNEVVTEGRNVNRDIGLNATARNEFNEIYNVGTPQDIPVSNLFSSGGFIIIMAGQGGIGVQTLIYPFVNQAGTVTIGTAMATTGAGVITSVTASGSNIRITPVAANTNIAYQLIEQLLSF